MSTASRLVAVMRVTEACNLSCGFCAYNRTLARPRAEADVERLIGVARSLFAHARRAGKTLHLSLLGGEPLLWPGLERLEDAAQGQAHVELGVTTNGTALGSSRVRERLLTRYRELTVSIDGLAETHNRLRGWPRGFEFLERTLPLLAERKSLLLRVNTVLMADNVYEFPKLCRKLSTLGVREVTFNQLGGRDRPAFFREHRLQSKHIVWLKERLSQLKAELAATGLKLRGDDGYLERFAATASGRALPIADCNPGERFLFVSEQGAISPCSFTTDAFGLPAEALELPAGFLELRRSRRPNVCDDCPSTQVFGKYAE